MEDKKLIDDVFYVELQSWGTYKSFDKEGKPLVTSLSEDACVSSTRFYLQGRQEGFSESKTYGETVSTYSGSIDYKL